MIFGEEKDYLTCNSCGYRYYAITKPKICPNPNCLKPLDETFTTHVKKQISQSQFDQLVPEPPIIEKEIKETSLVKQMEISKSTAARKIKGVKVKRKLPGKTINFSEKVIVIPSSGQYFKNFGVITESRIILYNKNEEFSYLHELSCNLDYIANSIMGGEIHHLILQSEVSGAIEKTVYLKQNGLIYFIYGMFADKQGYWIIKEMIKSLKSLIIGKIIDELDKIQLDLIKRKFDSALRYIMDEYIKMEDVLTKNEIPPVEDSLRFDYLGMSYKSIGTISKLLGEDLPIEMNMPGSTPAQIDDLKESLITAKIEAIAANTIANTQAFPKYLSVKLGYDKYRYLIFEKLENDYFFYFLVEGALNKFDSVIEIVRDMIGDVTSKPFKGDLKPFKELKKKIVSFFLIRTF